MSLRDILQDIHDRTGELTPQRVVDEAVDPEHPLHHRFTWDNTEAADKWRLHQAAALIRSVHVYLYESEPTRVYARAFIANRELQAPSSDADDEQSDTGVYLPVEQVISSDVLRTAWFQSLQRDWERLKRKAGASKEFAQMVLHDMRDMAG